MCVSCACAVDGVWCRLWGKTHRDRTHGMGMYVCSALYHTCRFARLRWRAVLDVITPMESHVSMYSLVRWHNTCVSWRCQIARHLLLCARYLYSNICPLFPYKIWPKYFADLTREQLERPVLVWILLLEEGKQFHVWMCQGNVRYCAPKQTIEGGQNTSVWSEKYRLLEFPLLLCHGSMFCDVKIRYKHQIALFDVPITRCVYNENGLVRKNRYTRFWC